MSSNELEVGNVGGVFLSKTPCGQQLRYYNSSGVLVDILTGNALSVELEYNFSLLPGQDVTLPIGDVTEVEVETYHLQSGFVPVVEFLFVDPLLAYLFDLPLVMYRRYWVESVKHYCRGHRKTFALNRKAEMANA